MDEPGDDKWVSVGDALALRLFAPLRDIISREDAKDARKLGETEQRIYLLSVWREAPNIFNDEEQLLLEMTEEITLIHNHGLSDHLYEKAINIWGEERTAQVIMAIININSWNRIGVGLNLYPHT